MKSETVQKAAVAKRILDNVSASGETHVGKRYFESGILIPKIRVTAIMIRCPVFLFFGI